MHYTEVGRIILYIQAWHMKKPSLYILEVTVSKYCGICLLYSSGKLSHTCIWWRKRSGGHKSVKQEVKVQWWERASFCLSHAPSISPCLYAPVKPRPVWLHLQHKPLNPWSLQCRKGHEEHMEGLWSLLVHGTDRWKNSGNFRKLDSF